MIIKAGSTNVSVYFYIVGDAGHATPGEPVTGLLFSDIETGGSASYARQGAARTDLTLVTLASASAAHSDGGFILVDDTNMPGVYRCDYPDAAFATGVDQVILSIVVASANNAVAAPIMVDIDGSVDQTGDSFARLGAPAGASVSADIADVPTVSEFNARTLASADYFDPAADTVANVTTVATLTGHTAQTGDSFARIGAAGAGLTAVPWNAAWDAEVQSECTDALNAYDPPTKTEMDTAFTEIKGATWSASTDTLEAIRDRGDAAWTTGAGGSDRLLMVDTTIATLATQTSFTLTAGSADDDAYNNCTIIVEDVSTATQKAVGMVLDYTGSTKTVTLKEALAFTIATTDKVYILAENSLKSTVANRQLDVTATGAAGIDWGNIENPTTAVDLSGTDIQLVDTCTTNTDMVAAAPTANANAEALLKLDLSTVTGEAARSVLNAMRFLRNRWTVSAGTLTVYKEDDSTSAWTGTVSSDAAADPITGNDPA